MFRYNLRTLLILLALGPPMLAYGYFKWQRHVHFQRVIKPLIEGMARTDRERQARYAALFQRQPAPQTKEADNP